MGRPSPALFFPVPAPPQAPDVSTGALPSPLPVPGPLSGTISKTRLIWDDFLGSVYEAVWTRSGADPVRAAVKVVKYLPYIIRIEEEKEVGEGED
ncbi:hypothetical protein M407DRAFT_128597 [Tulasnella calospora MUT 4182]|uniref:Uncharacterized protein n=1 Tax=Tulasnella calospora MUT 4182 TaxID=1051891 RepID=A0A0C3QRY2_9AGAM|nr:hypothetical protein M407DRAFT_128597 [Tulasnella calospora MUT 4182]